MDSRKKRSVRFQTNVKQREFKPRLSRVRASDLKASTTPIQKPKRVTSTTKAEIAEKQLQKETEARSQRLRTLTEQGIQLQTQLDPSIVNTISKIKKFKKSGLKTWQKALIVGSSVASAGLIYQHRQAIANFLKRAQEGVNTSINTTNRSMDNFLTTLDEARPEVSIQPVRADAGLQTYERFASTRQAIDDVARRVSTFTGAFSSLVRPSAIPATNLRAYVVQKDILNALKEIERVWATKMAADLDIQSVPFTQYSTTLSAAYALNEKMNTPAGLTVSESTEINNLVQKAIRIIIDEDIDTSNIAIQPALARKIESMMAVSATVKEQENVRTTLEQMQKTIDQLQTSLSQMRGEEFEARIAQTMTEQIEDLSNKSRAFIKENVDAASALIKKNMTNLEIRQVGFEKSIDQALSTVKTFMSENDYSKLKKDFTDLAKQVNDIFGDTDDGMVDEQIDLNKKRATLAARVSNLDAKMNSIQAKMEKVTTDYNALRASAENTSRTNVILTDIIRQYFEIADNMEIDDKNVKTLIGKSLTQIQKEWKDTVKDLQSDIEKMQKAQSGQRTFIDVKLKLFEDQASELTQKIQSTADRKQVEKQFEKLQITIQELLQPAGEVMMRDSPSELAENVNTALTATLEASANLETAKANYEAVVQRPGAAVAEIVENAINTIGANEEVVQNQIEKLSSSFKISDYFIDKFNIETNLIDIQLLRDQLVQDAESGKPIKEKQRSALSNKYTKLAAKIMSNTTVTEEAKTVVRDALLKAKSRDETTLMDIQNRHLTSQVAAQLAENAIQDMAPIIEPQLPLLPVDTIPTGAITEQPENVIMPAAVPLVSNVQLLPNLLPVANENITLLGKRRARTQISNERNKKRKQNK